MDVQSVGGGSSSAAQLAIEYQMRVAVLQKNAINQVGEETLRLLNSATVSVPGQGNNLDVRG